MAENTTIRDSFFDSLKKGAKWDVGVSINRTNPLPLDQYSVFKSETKLDEYIAGAFSYPGQILALVDEDETVIYYLDQNKQKQEVGSMPAVDNKSIKIKIDETTGEEILTLVGLDNATVGASLIKLADGSIGWSSTTQEGLTADLTGIKTDISELNTTVYGVADGTTAETGLVSKVEALENKFTSMGGIFNFAGSITVNVENPMPSANLYDIGDVLFVNGKEEWVCIADASNPGSNKWEPFGDPHGVEKLTGTVNGHTTQITGLTTRVSDLETSVGKEAEGETEATGLYAYVDSITTTKANAAQAAAEATAAAALSPVATQVETNKNNITAHDTAIGLKADTTYVDGQINAVNSEVAKKAVKTEVEAALDLKADKTTVANDLALKADKSAVETVTSGHETRISAAEGKIASLEGTVGKTGEGLIGRIETLENTDITHGQEINGLKQNLGTDADITTKDETGNYKNTAFGQAGKAQALATAANTAAGAAQAAAEAAQGTANGAQSAAEAAQSKANQAHELAETKVAKSDYDAKVKAIEDAVQANNTAITTKADQTYVNGELAKKVDKTTYEAKIGEINDAIALKADTETVNRDLATKADKTTTETAIKAIEDKIGTLGNVMNFVGELTKDDEGNISLEGKTPENGDVGFVDAFEYVYIDGEWVKFGDTSAESGRISALENTVGNLDNTGLVKDVADLKAADTTITGNITTLSTSVDSRFATVNETLTNLSDNKADKTALTAESEAREAAIKAEEEARIADVNAEEEARIAAVSALDTYVKDTLAWGTF